MKHNALYWLPLIGFFCFGPFASCEKLPNLGGADRNWLVGTWILDREKTVAALQKNTIGEDAGGDSTAGKIAMMAVQKSVETLISPLEKVKIRFTETEVIEDVGGYGTSKTYEIISRPGPNQIRIKDEKGIVNTYHLEDQNIWYNLRGQERLQIFLKPGI